MLNKYLDKMIYKPAYFFLTKIYSQHSNFEFSRALNLYHAFTENAGDDPFSLTSKNAKSDIPLGNYGRININCFNS